MLYAIKMGIRGHSAEDSQRERHQRSRPSVDALPVWLREQVARLSGHSKLAPTIRYAFNHCDGLMRFLDDGRLEMTSTSWNAPCVSSHMRDSLCSALSSS